ncbi:MAG: twin-arginine translocase subunit TatC [Solirubrobacteraceae bacterium]|nr:twin-arginine translocase subunit TatC [Solirubrobacteraceae bacterium]
MARLRPVGHDDRLTLVEHLTELRTRIFVCLGILLVAFSFTYWQHEGVLDLLNRPLDRAQHVDDRDCSKAGDPLEQGACFDRAVGEALGRLRPAVDALSGTITDATTGGTAAERAAVDARLQELRRASQALADAQRLAPESTGRKPVTLGVAEPFFQTLNVAFYAAVLIALPLLLYQLYAFLIPAFTNRERKAIVPLMIGVPFLFYAGVAFGFLLALPRAIDFLQNFNDESFDILVQARDYYRFIILFLAGTGIVFQVPVVVLAISRLGILTARQLRKQRGMVVVISSITAAVITPTPDPMTMLIVMAPLVLLFEASTWIASWLERRAPVSGTSRWDWDDDEDDDDDPPGPDGDPGPNHGTRITGPTDAAAHRSADRDGASSAGTGAVASTATLDDDVDWWDRADALDDEDPYADPPPGG